jgi:hypothetical protein
MSYTVGLDFGTHQTKVCIEDASNPAQKIYEFLEFNDGMNNKTVLFPSIVQINKDETVSYGFVDNINCKTVNSTKTIKPKINLLPRPVLELPEGPYKENYPAKPKKEKKKINLSWKEQLQQLKKGKSQNSNYKALLKEWELKCKKIDLKYKNQHEQWLQIVQEKKLRYKYNLNEWEKKNKSIQSAYNIKLKEWEDNRVDKLRFRYFKQATFSNSIKWNHDISPVKISVWYLAYILLLLQAKFGEDFYLQMGIPSGINENILKKQKKIAYAILISAYKLVEHFKTKKDFVEAKYSDLLKLTEINDNYSEEDLLYYGIKVVPEAFAGLSSITQQKRLETGMSLLVDIGGGTTDIAFFTIREEQPDIHGVISFPKGLNFIFEQYIIQNKHLSISDVQKHFLKKKGDILLFSSSIDKYREELVSKAQNMVSEIRTSFRSRYNYHRLPITRLNNAFKNRPVVFCGGGAIYKSMQKPLLDFTDIKIINKNLLNIPSILNRNIDEKLYTILATSYGLSIPLENDIKLTPIDKVFNHIDNPDLDNNTYNFEYGLTDT